MDYKNKWAFFFFSLAFFSAAHSYGMNENNQDLPEQKKKKVFRKKMVKKNPLSFLMSMGITKKDQSSKFTSAMVTNGNEITNCCGKKISKKIFENLPKNFQNRFLNGKDENFSIDRYGKYHCNSPFLFTDESSDSDSENN